jgi:hypothetical protein
MNAFTLTIIVIFAISDQLIQMDIKRSDTNRSVLTAQCFPNHLSTINEAPMKNLWKIPVLLFVIFMFFGCATQRSWVYRPNQTAPLGVAAKTDKTIATLPFADARENENVNHVLLYMVPLALYGSQNFSVPEGAQMHITSGLWINYKPTEDFAKALALELQGTGLFKEAYFDFKAGNASYTVQGSIKNTDYNGKMFSYCLSVYGPLLWFVGFPCATVTNSLEIELACVDMSTNTAILKKTYRAEPVSNTSWIYHMQNDFNYPDMLQKIYIDFCKDLVPLVAPENH